MPTRTTTAALLLALGAAGALSVGTPIAADPADPAGAAPAEPATDAGPADGPAADDSDAEDSGLFADPEPGEGDPDTPRVEGEDLPLGEPRAVEGAEGTFRFVADQPGMLTLLAYAPGDRTRARLDLKDAQGARVPGGAINGNPNEFGPRIVVDRNGNRVGALPGLTYATVVVPEPGEYAVEFAIQGELDGPAKIGAAWVPFEQAPGIEAPPPPVAPPGGAVPPPPPPPVEAIDPTDAAVELAVGERGDIGIDDGVGWVKLTAEEPGTLVLATRSSDADVRLEVFADGQFNNAVEYVDDDRNGNLGHEAVMFHAAAGQTWYVRINASGAESVPARTIFIADDLEPAEDQ